MRSSRLGLCPWALAPLPLTLALVVRRGFGEEGGWVTWVTLCHCSVGATQDCHVTWGRRPSSIVGLAAVSPTQHRDCPRNVGLPNGGNPTALRPFDVLP